MSDILLARSIILSQEGDSFAYDHDRLPAARTLRADFEGLRIISEYGKLRECYSVREPFPDVERCLYQKWEVSARPYQRLRPDRLMNCLAEYYLGKPVLFDEDLPSEQYEQLYQAFQSILVPALMVGRIDALAAGRVKSNTLLKILVGYDEFLVFTQAR